MSKPLPPEDYRSTRIVLEPDDFALSSGPEPPPSDLVHQDTWYGITLLPDDVAIRTSNHHGNLLAILYNLWAAWIEAVGQEQDPLYTGILDASDEYQASTYNALCGYYRQAIGCLRNAIEQIAIASYCQTCHEEDLFTEWRSGRVKITFGQACDHLNGAESIQPLNTELQAKLGDSLFLQKNGPMPGGWARRLYYELSDYTHTKPGYAD